jgi:cytochrome P450 family 110
MPVTALPPHESLNPLQVWKFLSYPKDAAARLFKRYGALAPIKFLGATYTMVLTPEAALEVFAQPPEMYVAFFHESFAGMNGEGSLWILAGEAHRRERKLFAPAVHPAHFQAYGDVIRDVARLHFASWRVGETYKSVETTKAIALDVIMRLVFGVEDEQLMREGGTVLDRLTGSIHPLIVFYPKLQRSWFPLFRRYQKAKAAMYEWAGRLIALRRSRGTLGDDVLGRLMRANDEHGRPYTELHICNELLSILTAGHVTTGVALAWALYEIGRHPDVLDRLRAELIEAGPAPASHVVAALPYLSAVCNETIRLHPILAECARVPVEPVQILGHDIAAGEPLVIAIAGIHHDPKIFPDPGRFLPDRFIERSYSKTEFMPFGGGHRRCLGAGLADYTIRISLAEAVMSWTFEAAAVDRDIRHDIAMGPKLGVPLRVLSPFQAPAPDSRAEAGRSQVAEIVH